MIAVGSDENNVTYGGKVQIYEYNEITRFVLISLDVTRLSIFFSFCVIVSAFFLDLGNMPKPRHW